MAELFRVDPGPQVHRIKAIGPVMGLDVSQTHRLARKLKFPGWGVGQGQERRLSTFEVFVLKVAGLVDGAALPLEALRNATSAAAVYFCAVEGDLELRAKSALLLGYQVEGGGWCWLLGHSGKWPDQPPAVRGLLLVTIRISEALAAALRGCGESWPGMPEPQADEPPQPLPAVAAELARALMPHDAALAAIDKVEASRVALMARKAAMNAKLAAHKAREGAAK